MVEADSLATGPSAWGGWKAGLVADLVERTSQLLAGEPAPPPPRWITDELAIVMDTVRTHGVPALSVEPPDGDRRGPGPLRPARRGDRRPGPPRAQRALGRGRRRARRGGRDLHRRPGPGPLAGRRQALQRPGRGDGRHPRRRRAAGGPGPHLPERPPDPRSPSWCPPRSRWTTTPRPPPPWSRCGPRTWSDSSTGSPRPWSTATSTSPRPRSPPSARPWSTPSTCGAPTGASSPTRPRSPPSNRPSTTGWPPDPRLTARPGIVRRRPGRDGAPRLRAAWWTGASDRLVGSGQIPSCLPPTHTPRRPAIPPAAHLAVARRGRRRRGRRGVPPPWSGPTGGRVSATHHHADARPRTVQPAPRHRLGVARPTVPPAYRPTPRVTVRFSEPLSAHSPPTLTPPVAGTWQHLDPDHPGLRGLGAPRALLHRDRHRARRRRRRGQRRRHDPGPGGHRPLHRGPRHHPPPPAAARPARLPARGLHPGRAARRTPGAGPAPGGHLRLALHRACRRSSRCGPRVRPTSSPRAR